MATLMEMGGGLRRLEGMRVSVSFPDAIDTYIACTLCAVDETGSVLLRTEADGEEFWTHIANIWRIKAA